MWMHKESKWLVRGGRKVRCYLCGKKILKKDPCMFHENTGYYSHNFCIMEANTIDRNERRRAVKKIAVGAAVVGAMAAGAGKFIDISSQSKGSNSPDTQTILTSQGLIPPALTSDPANPVPGQMWYRSDAGVMAHFDAVQNRVVYSSEINDGNVNVTSKGIINGLSVLPNDGKGGFGPDTTEGATAPGQYGSPYTETLGLQEVLSYWKSNPSVKIVIAPGVYDITDAPFQSFSTSLIANAPSTIYCQLLIPNVTTSTSPTPWFGLSIKGNPVMSVGPATSLDAAEAVIIKSGASTTSTLFDHFIMAAEVNPNNTDTYTNYINADIDLAFQVDYGNNLGCFWGGGLSSISSDFLEGIVLNLTAPPVKAVGFVFNSVFGESYIKKINIMGFEYGMLIANGHMLIDFYQTYFNTVAVWVWATNGAYPIKFGLVDYQNTSYLFTSTGAISGGPFSGNLNFGLIGIGDINSIPITNLFSWSSSYTFNCFVDCISSNSALSSSIISSIPSSSGIVKVTNIIPVITPTIPSVPSSGTAQENTNPYAVDVYVYGGDVTEIQITRGGTANTVFSVSTAIAMSGQGYRLNPGDSITVTYSTAPTWEWL